MGNARSKQYTSVLERPRCVIKGCVRVSYPEYILCLDHIKSNEKEKRIQSTKVNEQHRRQDVTN